MSSSVTASLTDNSFNTVVDFGDDGWREAVAIRAAFVVGRCLNDVACRVDRVAAVEPFRTMILQPAMIAAQPFLDSQSLPGRRWCRRRPPYPRHAE